MPSGDEIQVTVTFSETVEVTGTPELRLELGEGQRTATYEGGRERRRWCSATQ